MASPVFKTVWSGVSRTEGSTPFLLRQRNIANNFSSPRSICPLLLALAPFSERHNRAILGASAFAAFGRLRKRVLAL